MMGLRRPAATAAPAAPAKRFKGGGQDAYAAAGPYVTGAGSSGGKAGSLPKASPAAPAARAQAAPEGKVKSEPAADAAAGAGEPETYEVRYATPEEAETALQLDGSEVEGTHIAVTLDETSKDRTKVIVNGLPPGIDFEEVKNVFAGAGRVVFAGPPKKPSLKGSGGGPNNGVGEVRYETPEEAAQAVSLLDGSVIEGATIQVLLDQSSKDGSKLLITGLPGGIQWQELKDYCSQAGRVAYVATKQAPLPSGAGFGGDGCEGEVRYDEAEHAQAALYRLNGSFLGGKQIWVRADPNSKDRTRLMVSGFPQSIQWQELKDHFSPIGTVAFAQVKSPPGGGKGPAPFGGGRDVAFGAANAGGMFLWGARPQMFMPGKGMLGGKQGVPGMFPGVPMLGGGKDMWNDPWLGKPSAAPWVGRAFPAAPDKGSGKGGGGGSVGGAAAGEVRFDSPIHAKIAVAKLNGSYMQGARLTVSMDDTSQDGSKINIHGIPPGCQWQELKDHFSGIGTVAFASIIGPGEVRMETPEEAQKALSMLNGYQLMGCTISVALDKNSKDGTRLLVNNLPSSVTWQQMKDLFGQAGSVAFATRQELR